MPEEKLTGGLVNYYLVKIKDPQRTEQPPYQAECEDIIRALNMTFDEGCEFKAIWRTAAARLGNGKPGTKAVYDAEKRVHYAKASLRQLQNQEAVARTEQLLQPVVTEKSAWHLWTGGEYPPTPRTVIVEVQMRNGNHDTGPASSFAWTHKQWGTDVLKYRII